MACEFIIRRSEDEDFEHWNKCYNEVTGRKRTLEQCLWQWRGLRGEASESWVICSVSTGEVVGHHGVMRIPFQRYGERLSVGKTENTFVMPAFRKRLYYPAYEKKVLARIQGSFGCIFTTATGISNGYINVLRRRLGYVPQGSAVCHALRMSSRAAGLLVCEKYRLPGVLSPLLGAGYSAVVSCLRKKRSGGVHIHGADFKDSVETLASFWQVNADCYPLTPERNEAFLQWRWLDNPHHEYELILFERKGLMVGYAVCSVRVLQTKSGMLDAVYVEDIVVQGNDEEDLKYCFVGIAKYYSNHDLVLFVTLDTSSSPMLALSGFNSFLSKHHMYRGPEFLARCAAKHQGEWYFSNALSEGTNYQNNVEL